MSVHQRLVDAVPLNAVARVRRKSSALQSDPASVCAAEETMPIPSVFCTKRSVGYEEEFVHPNRIDVAQRSLRGFPQTRHFQLSADTQPMEAVLGLNIKPKGCSRTWKTCL